MNPKGLSNAQLKAEWATADEIEAKMRSDETEHRILCSDRYDAQAEAAAWEAAHEVWDDEAPYGWGWA